MIFKRIGAARSLNSSAAESKTASLSLASLIDKGKAKRTSYRVRPTSISE
jgi:hypothetical protein